MAVQKTWTYLFYIYVHRPPSDDYKQWSEMKMRQCHCSPYWSRAKLIVVDSREVNVLRSCQASTPVVTNEDKV